MNKKMFFKTLNNCIYLEDEITHIIFKDEKNYRDFLYNMDDNIIYSIDNQPLDYKKDTLIINDPLQFDINDKKILTIIYKKISKIQNDEIKEKVMLVEKSIIDLLDELIYLTDYNLTYNVELDLLKLFSMYQLSIKNYKNENFLDFLVTYIKINNELYHFTNILSIGLIRILSENEILQLKTELSILNIKLIDIDIVVENKTKSIINIDKDWCIY